ncbi:glycosyl transferase [Marinomonas posidonica]|uniref:Glycosyl transferase family 17 n=1 Tax=Marinomonas posidonica (strain CECT 7376 / NCIMB 14433 / IVIA-Po-181) TaxID=491952 RepID=F6CZN7_MARPP|nr:glycosyl transferase [Marinomonas posidonica]AEF53548.1 glycosyl transferase family 17 [Marinomonas posidonica IVIA-Po-181]
MSEKKLIDVFLFYNELDLLELRLKSLYEFVDFFVITECEETFSGKKKELLFLKNRERFLKFEDKIIYNRVSNKDLAFLQSESGKFKKYITNFDVPHKHKHSNRPANILHSSLKREITHRDSAILGLVKIAKYGDIVFISDVDEIPNPNVVKSFRNKKIESPSYFEMKWYMYWVNNQVSKCNWYGTVAFEYSMLEGKSLDLLRYSSSDHKNVPGLIIKNAGWHFSYLGGADAISNKLDALPYQGLKAEISKFLNKISFGGWDSKLKSNKDILLQNRKFNVVEIDESFPEEIFLMPLFDEVYFKKINRDEKND